jgi:hypothetical protein
VITLKDVWTDLHATNKETAKAISDLNATLGQILGHLETVDNRNRAADALHVDFETRLRALERWRYALPASVFLALASAAAAILPIVIHK